ncbi:MAG: hypothetical protein ABIV42_01210 [Nitrosospira sp.]
MAAGFRWNPAAARPTNHTRPRGDIETAKRFYQDVLGLELLMDHGWIATYGSRDKMSIQISFASHGGSGTPTPDLSIEVNDLDAAFE